LPELTHNFAMRPAQVRRAIEAHRAWIENRLGSPLSEAVIVAHEKSLTEAAIPDILGYSDARLPTTRPVSRLKDLVESVEIPPLFPPYVELGEAYRMGDLAQVLMRADSDEASPYAIAWIDCPVLFHIRGLDTPIVALSVFYLSAPDSISYSVEHVVIAARKRSGQVISFLRSLTKLDCEPQLHVLNGGTQSVARCHWRELVLDPNIVGFLQKDFHSFFDRKSWFRKMKIPFRRGYLLHGPPGNGKTSAVRAMLTSRGLTAYTIRLFDPQVGDRELEKLFEHAANNGPSVVLLEDLDRAFPRTGQSRTHVSLQALLNCLDGVATGEGIVTVATANEPTILDSAILRRPGRFDRVVLFPNPAAALRHEYFCRYLPCEEGLETVVAESDGFSFAQLRESWVLAAQIAFETTNEVTVTDLLGAVRWLRKSVLFGALNGKSTGFRVAEDY
jgi:hypothetical protein